MHACAAQFAMKPCFVGVMSWLMHTNHLVLNADVFMKTAITPYKIYCDSIYSTAGFLVAPQKGRNVSAAQKSFNRRMAAFRVTVEWSLGERSLLMHDYF